MKNQQNEWLTDYDYKSMEQSTQTVRIPTAFTHRTRATTSTHLRTQLASIEAQQERERHRRHRQEFQRIHQLFNNLTINIKEQQRLAHVQHLRNRQITNMHTNVYNNHNINTSLAALAIVT